MNIAYKNKLQFRDSFSEQKIEKLKNIQILMEGFLKTHSLFKDREVEISFFKTGVASFVCLLTHYGNAGVKKYIFKVPLFTKGNDTETLFLKAWAEVGVLTPQIIETGYIEGYYYMIMEYVDFPLVFDYYADAKENLFKDGMYYKLGHTLKKMHSVSGEGFGKVVKGKGLYKSLKDYFLENNKLEENISYIKEHDIMDYAEYLSFHFLHEIFSHHVNTDIKTSCYAHNDLSLNNIFLKDQKDFIVFDPNPLFSHPYLDVAHSIVCAASSVENILSVFDQITSGYFKEGECNMELMHGALLHAACIKLPYWHKKGYHHRVERLNKFLRNY